MKPIVTPEFSKPALCVTCTHALIRKGEREGQTETLCGYLGDKPVLFKVTDCNAYRAENSPSLGMMKEIAWLITPKGRSVGFSPPDKAEEFTAERRQQLKDV